MALRIESSSVRGRPRRLAAGSKGSISSHWSGVRLLGYDLLTALWGLLFCNNSLYPKSFSSDNGISQTSSKVIELNLVTEIVVFFNLKALSHLSNQQKEEKKGVFLPSAAQSTALLRPAPIVAVSWSIPIAGKPI
jgi:hypothetical protein